MSGLDLDDTAAVEQADPGEMLRAVDIAEAITFTITRSRHAAVNEMVVRPTEQER